MIFDKTKLTAMKRVILVLALVLVAGVSVTGCMRGGNVGENVGVNERSVTQPSPSPDYMPEGAAQRQAARSSAPEERRVKFDWTSKAPEIEGRIAQLSEISEARVVVSGDTALVAVHFNQAYQGEMTERIREMIAAEVMKADPDITTVAVTADAEDVNSVYEISDRVLGGTAMEDLKEDIQEIVRNATTLR